MTGCLRIEATEQDLKKNNNRTKVYKLRLVFARFCFLPKQ